MVENMIERLRAKGWTPDEIADALRVMNQAQSQKSKTIRAMDRCAYWGLLFIILIGHFVVSVIMIPFMVFATPLYVYAMILVIAATFGALYDLILYDINTIEGSTQFMPGLLLPALAIINIYVSISLATSLAIKVGAPISGSAPFIIGAMYLLGVMAPYWFTQRTRFWEQVFTGRKTF